MRKSLIIQTALCLITVGAYAAWLDGVNTAGIASEASVASLQTQVQNASVVKQVIAVQDITNTTPYALISFGSPGTLDEVFVKVRYGTAGVTLISQNRTNQMDVYDTLQAQVHVDTDGTAVTSFNYSAISNNVSYGVVATNVSVLGVSNIIEVTYKTDIQ